MPALRAACAWLLLVLGGPGAAHAQYSDTLLYDVQLNAWQYQLFDAGFQFGVFIVQARWAREPSANMVRGC